MATKRYLNKDVARITGMEQQTIAYYSNTGLVIPSVDPGKGRGSNRYYSVKDIVKFLLIKELSSLGLSLKKIKTVFDQLSHGDVLNPSDPTLRMEQPIRLILGIYNAQSDDLVAKTVSMGDPVGMKEYCQQHPTDGLGRAIDVDKILQQMEGGLKYFQVDMLNNKSVILLDITAIYRSVEE
jgi:DNA-binding transcriptional MerR regulator